MEALKTKDLVNASAKERERESDGNDERLWSTLLRRDFNIAYVMPRGRGSIRQSPSHPMFRSMLVKLVPTGDEPNALVNLALIEMRTETRKCIWSTFLLFVSSDT
jgi:hypothetical protein